MKPAVRAQRAFSLVEVVLAIGVASFCLVPLLGVLVVGSNTTQTSNNETQAMHLLTQVVDDLQVAAQSTATPAPTVSPYYQIPLPGNSTGSTMTVNPQSLYLTADGSATGAVGTAPGAGAMFRVTLGFLPPNTATGISAGAAVRVLVSWPAFADAVPTSWPAKYSGSVETVFVLNKN